MIKPVHANYTLHLLYSEPRWWPAMQILYQLAVIVLGLSVAGGTTSASPANTPAAACTVTMPNGIAPPGMQPDPNWYGNGKLWAVLSWPDGTVVFRPGGPGFVQRDGALGMKFGWWRGVKGKLSVSGKRLDAAAPPLRASIPDGYGDRGFQSMYLIFPTPGCWQVTGKVGDARLSFVTRVAKIKNGPSWHREG